MTSGSRSHENMQLLETSDHAHPASLQISFVNFASQSIVGEMLGLKGKISSSQYLSINPPPSPDFWCFEGGGYVNFPKKSAPAAGLKHMIYTVYEGYYKQNKNYKYTTVDIRRKSNLYYKSELLA